jgi:hypothetical protein
MYKKISAMLLLAAPLAHADVVELSPDLYLAIRTSRVEDAVAIKVGAITEANQYAATTGRVAVPVTGRLSMLGPLLKAYEYQFRLMSRAQALEAKPTLADVVVAVNGVNVCGERAAPAVAALMPELSRIDVLRDRKLLAANEPEEEDEQDELPAPAQASPSPPPDNDSAPPPAAASAQ